MDATQFERLLSMMERQVLATEQNTAATLKLAEAAAGAASACFEMADIIAGGDPEPDETTERDLAGRPIRRS